MKYSASVNKTQQFFNIDSSSDSVDGHYIDWDLRKLDDKRYSILYHGKVYNAELLEIDKVAGVVSMKINGRLFTTGYTDEYEQLLKRMGIGRTISGIAPELKAPMPGMVMKVLIVEGAEIKKGDPLLVLEAMKMENIIKAADGGIVRQVFVKAGDKVEKNQVIMNFQVPLTES